MPIMRLLHLHMHEGSQEVIDIRSAKTSAQGAEIAPEAKFLLFF